MRAAGQTHTLLACSVEHAGQLVNFTRDVNGRVTRTVLWTWPGLVEVIESHAFAARIGLCVTWQEFVSTPEGSALGALHYSHGEDVARRMDALLADRSCAHDAAIATYLLDGVDYRRGAEARSLHERIRRQRHGWWTHCVLEFLRRDE